jgi:hypothetical protein
MLALRAIGDRAVATVAIIEKEFREHSARPECGLGKQAGRTLDRFGLAHGPQPDAIEPAFARGIVGIDIMVLLKRAEEIELE